jgi:glycosyltransferase involved in cell wall biosynthesis
MNVLTLLDAISVSGPAKGLLQLVGAADELGVRFTICNFVYPGRPSELNALASQRLERFELLSQRGRWDWRFLRHLHAIAIRDQIDVVQSHSFKPHVAAHWLARRLDLPWLAFAHGWTQEDYKVRVYNALEQRLLRRADHVVAVTERIRGILIARGRRAPISVVPNAIDQRVMVEAKPELRPQARARLGAGAEDLLLATIGRLSFEKGQDILLSALTELSSTRRLRVVIAGDGPARARLEAMVRERGLAEQVSFLGHVSDPSWIYAAADALVIPSRSEGVPNVALEALAHGVPMVAMEVGSLGDMVIPGETGWLVARPEPRALARALEELVLSRQRLADMGRSGRDRILPRFGIERRIAAMRSIYRGLSPDGINAIKVGG